MTPLEKLKALEAATFPAPWWEIAGFDDGSVQLWDGSVKVQEDMRLGPDSLPVVLRNLAPELIALWEAAERWNSKDSTGFDAIRLEGKLAALNAKAKEVLG